MLNLCRLYCIFILSDTESNNQNKDGFGTFERNCVVDKTPSVLGEYECNTRKDEVDELSPALGKLNL